MSDVNFQAIIRLKFSGDRQNRVQTDKRNQHNVSSSLYRQQKAVADS